MLYLHDIPLPEAWAKFEEALKSVNLWGVLGIEEIPLTENALGRVLAEPVWAKISSPNYHASAMDGFAVRSRETEEAIPASPCTLIYGTQTAYVDTGDPLPAWADAVIPIENVEPIGESGRLTADARHPYAIRIRASVTPWSHVRPMGEDLVATQLVLPAGQTLRPVDLGAIAAGGQENVWAARQPRVAILPTGSELVPIGQAVRPGDIIEYNSLVMAAQVNSWGGVARRYPITHDDFMEINRRVQEAARENDLILLNAGSSAGSEDYSARVIAGLGQLLVHGVAVRPGHPVILGMIRKNGGSLPGGDVQSSQVNHSKSWIPVIGVPGYPVSAALTGEIFVEPLLDVWLGRPHTPPPVIRATVTRKITSPAGDDDFVRFAVGKVGDRVLAAPLARGAGVITSLVRADGLGLIPRGTQGLPAGEGIDIRLYRPLVEIERTIFAIGSHDITLDLLAQFLAAHERRLVSANVGSLGGLVALKRGEAHLAGSHLLDPQTGEYNLSYLPQYLPGVPIIVIALVNREQGLIVAKDNPKGIRSLADLARPEVTLVNRQRGAGTRLLLDYHLDASGIAKEAVRGYNHEEYTHLAVAAAVASGRADCGLGIAAAAKALEIDFIPLFAERYDLIVPREHYQSRLLQPLFEVLKDRIFMEAVAAMPGYDTTLMGTTIAELSP
jgi:putative molybdopterin biosynthesis protein